MKFISLLIAVPLLIMALPVFPQTPAGQGPMKFSLEEAKSFALSHSPVLLNAARDVEIAKKMVWENTATGLPQADLSSSYSYAPKLSGLTSIFTGGDTASGGGGGNPFGFDINPNDLKTSFFMNIRVSQLLFSGQYIVGLKAAKVYENLSVLANSKSETGLAESITNTYFTVLVAKESGNILDSTLSMMQKTLFQTEQMYKNGFVESTDVDQLKILVFNIKSTQSVTERQIKLVERLLKFQMGIPIDQPVELTDQIDPLITVMNIQASAMDSFKLENNVDYQMLTTQEKLMKLNMHLKMAQFLPTLSGYYNRYEDFDNNFFNDQSPNMLGLSLNFPLWTSGQRISQVGQSKLDYLKARTNTQMASQSLLIQYETAQSDFLSARDVYVMQKESRDLALKIYDKSLKKYAEGVGSSLDLNQTQSQYFDAEAKYLSALISLVSAKSKLESLLADTVK